MGPLALLALAGGIGGLASIMKEKGIDLKKKKPSKDQIKKVAKDVLKKKKKKVDPWIKVKADIKKRDERAKKIEGQRETWKKTKKGFFDSLERMMN